MLAVRVVVRILQDAAGVRGHGQTRVVDCQELLLLEGLGTVVSSVLLRPYREAMIARAT